MEAVIGSLLQGLISLLLTPCEKIANYQLFVNGAVVCRHIHLRSMRDHLGE